MVQGLGASPVQAHVVGRPPGPAPGRRPCSCMDSPPAARIEDLLRCYPDVQAEVDAGYQGLARDFPAQVSAPPKKPGKNAPPEETASWEQRRHQQSSQRICIEHAIAEPRQWRTLQRYLGRREYFQETALAIAGPVSDRAAAR